MRNDFVIFYDIHKIGKIAKVDQVLRHSCLLLYDDNEIIVNYEKIHPIEITRKILNDNGFTTQYIESIDTIIYVHKGFPFVIEVVFDTNDNIPHKKLYSVCYKNNEVKNGDSLDTIINIQYVHELQHLLNIFNINLKV